jgi:bifunctional DNA-binding transcriptional regulator/antitoxin component of YhaV-PrlF toxin-antitoxin module
MGMTTTLSPKRQVSIPKNLCDQLKIEPGARIAWEIEDGRLVGHPLPADVIRKLTGIYKDGPDLVARLLADRKADRELSDRKTARSHGSPNAKKQRRPKKS